MPAIYAHDRFGEKVSALLKGIPGDTVCRFYTQFEIGLQGPDPFFFYRFNTSNPVVTYGEDLHHIPARVFFEHAASVIRKKGRNSKEYAYLLGFLCHYVLDSESHPYVNAMAEKTGIHHIEIEEEYDKALLRLDGQDPFTYNIAALVPTDEATVRAMHLFFHSFAPIPVPEGEEPDPEGIYSTQDSPVTARLIYRSLLYMRFIKWILTPTTKVKSVFLNAVLRATGHYHAMKGQVYQRKDEPLCKETTSELLQRFDSAVPLALDLIAALDQTICSGAPLPERFLKTFD